MSNSARETGRRMTVLYTSTSVPLYSRIIVAVAFFSRVVDPNRCGGGVGGTDDGGMIRIVRFIRFDIIRIMYLFFVSSSCIK